MLAQQLVREGKLGEALAAEPRADGALLLDGTGRRQPLCGLYRRDALLRAAPAAVEDWHGLAIHRLLAGLRLLEVAAYGGEERDVDTWEDLRRERTLRKG